MEENEESLKAGWAKGVTLLSTPSIAHTGGLAARPGSCRIVLHCRQILTEMGGTNAGFIDDGLRGDLEATVGLVVQFSAVGVPSGLMGVWR